MPAPLRQRNYTPPQIAERFGVSTMKVLGWIKAGELRAINVASRDCLRPRYSVSPESLAEFERLRQVVPDCISSTPRLRRRAAPGTKEFF